MRIFLTIIAGIFLTVPACKDPCPQKADTLKIDASSDTAIDFYSFLEAIKLRIRHKRHPIVICKIARAAELSFLSHEDYSFDAVFLYITRNGVTLNSDQLLTDTELESTLKLLAKAAASSGSKAYIAIASDKDVPLEFGIKLLKAIHAAGIPNVLLAIDD
jgi:hypothetical protein